MQDFEKLGAFYLGKMYDLDTGTVRPDLLLYDAKDLTTHAVCVGMTGSGKTGLCLSLLEEAAIDGIPALAIDPKGDLGNLLLAFPDLQSADFAPWIDSGEAARQGCTAEQYAEQVGERWRNGLAEWGQDAARIERFRSAVDINIYTPGSNAGLPLTVMKSFTAPPAAIVQDAEAFRERIMSAVAGLLALLGIQADPVTSREHILLSNLFDRAWREGRSLDLASLIREIQSPPFKQIGVMDLETIFPAAERFGLAMRFNNLIASPGFSAWMEGESLDVQRLLFTPEGRPRLSIISIAHLSDSQRMFFVTTLLNEVVSWMRSQPGTSSLRAVLYMDEIFGYFPPTANPPSKLPMLTLMKQARAFGLGVVLATQNPVDLDYKGLSNAGTWFLGRLQTERDKARVLDGLEGASAAAGSTFDRARMETILSGLGNRVFLMNNVHEDQPAVFQSRWALSYLRGPLTRSQIETLMREKKSGRAVHVAATSPLVIKPDTIGQRPVVPPGIEELFLRAEHEPAGNERVVYQPAVLGCGRVHFVKAADGIDEWRDIGLLARVGDEVPGNLWEEADPIEGGALNTDPQPRDAASFATLPSDLAQPKKYAAWNKHLKEHLYRQETLKRFECLLLKMKSQPGEPEGDFRVRLKTAATEHRDLELERLRKKYAPKLQSLQERIRKAEQKVEQEKNQAKEQTWATALNVGTTMLGALLGRKLTSATNVTRAASSMRSAGKIAKESSDVGRAQDNVEALQAQLQELEEEFTRETDALREQSDTESLQLQETTLTPRKGDLTVDRIAWVWVPVMMAT